jgi:hypothetical protein
MIVIAKHKMSSNALVLTFSGFMKLRYNSFKLLIVAQILSCYDRYFLKYIVFEGMPYKKMLYARKIRTQNADLTTNKNWIPAL